MTGLRTMVSGWIGRWWPEPPPPPLTEDEQHEKQQAFDRADRAIERADDVWQRYVREGWGDTARTEK